MKPEFPPGLSQAEIERLKRKQLELSNTEKTQNGSNKKKKHKKKANQDNNSSSKENNIDGEHESQLGTLEKGVLALGIRDDDISTGPSEDNGIEKVLS